MALGVTIALQRAAANLAASQRRLSSLDDDCERLQALFDRLDVEDYASQDSDEGMLTDPS